MDVELISGGEELEKKLQEAREDFASIGQSMAAIEDLELKRESQRLHKTAGNLIHFLEKNPEKSCPPGALLIITRIRPQSF